MTLCMEQHGETCIAILTSNIYKRTWIIFSCLLPGTSVVRSSLRVMTIQIDEKARFICEVTILSLYFEWDSKAHSNLSNLKFLTWNLRCREWLWLLYQRNFVYRKISLWSWRKFNFSRWMIVWSLLYLIGQQLESWISKKYLWSQ